MCDNRSLTHVLRDSVRQSIRSQDASCIDWQAFREVAEGLAAAVKNDAASPEFFTTVKRDTAALRDVLDAIVHHCKEQLWMECGG